MITIIYFFDGSTRRFVKKFKSLVIRARGKRGTIDKRVLYKRVRKQRGEKRRNNEKNYIRIYRERCLLFRFRVEWRWRVVFLPPLRQNTRDGETRWSEKNYVNLYAQMCDAQRKRDFFTRRSIFQNAAVHPRPTLDSNENPFWESQISVLCLFLDTGRQRRKRFKLKKKNSFLSDDSFLDKKFVFVQRLVLGQKIHFCPTTRSRTGTNKTSIYFTARACAGRTNRRAPIDVQ